MNRVGVFLRRSGSQNKFRAAILNTLRSPLVDEALLCSGFFQEDGKYSAGLDFAITSHRPCVPLTLTTLGLYSYGWRTQFNNFADQLRMANCPVCLSTKQKRIPGMGWHAKVFIARQGPRPLVAIVGSSNITRRAFGAFSEFNYECDVVMWEESVPLVDAAVEAAIGAGDVVDDGIGDVIVTTYDEAHPANRRRLEDRLVSLEREILALAVDM